MARKKKTQMPQTSVVPSSTASVPGPVSQPSAPQAAPQVVAPAAQTSPVPTETVKQTP